nr:uncharacterized protein LOC106047521 isoform X2 [Anser cygnoides]
MGKVLQGSAHPSCSRLRCWRGGTAGGSPQPGFGEVWGSLLHTNTDPGGSCMTFRALSSHLPTHLQSRRVLQQVFNTQTSFHTAPVTALGVFARDQVLPRAIATRGCALNELFYRQQVTASSSAARAAQQSRPAAAGTHRGSSPGTRCSLPPGCSLRLLGAERHSGKQRRLVLDSCCQVPQSHLLSSLSRYREPQTGHCIPQLLPQPDLVACETNERPSVPFSLLQPLCQWRNVKVIFTFIRFILIGRTGATRELQRRAGVYSDSVSRLQDGFSCTQAPQRVAQGLQPPCSPPGAAPPASQLQHRHAGQSRVADDNSPTKS